MRLTAELISRSLSYSNALKERELDLRGHQIPTIENLGGTRDAFEAIDLTDNAITLLGNFPRSLRLQTLLLARNRVNCIHSSLAKSLPNLRCLVLTGNPLEELADLDPLHACSRLEFVSLLECPVSAREYYRYYILWQCPKIRFLDYQKVKDAERARANELFGSHDSPTDLAKSIMALPLPFDDARTLKRWIEPLRWSRHPIESGHSGGFIIFHHSITDNERRRLETLVKKAKTLSEIQKLEKAFAEGTLPPGVADQDMMDET